jgi:hypothetical protein
MAKKMIVQGITLSQLADGYAGRAIDSGLKRVTEDIIERGGDGKTRTLNLKIQFTPDETGCEIDVEVGVKIPGYKPPKTRAKVDERAGGLIFNPDCSENPDQAALPGAGATDD